MPINDFLCFKVMVANQELQEYVDDETGNIFIEADLHSNSSYIIAEETQSYPVTPFCVWGEFLNQFGCPCYLRLSVDGQVVWMKPFPPNELNRAVQFYVRGYKNQDTIRELVFSLPKMCEDVQETQKDKLSEVGTIKVECIEGIAKGCHQVRTRVFQDFNHDIVSSDSKFQQAHKQSSEVGVTAREGRMLSNITTCNRFKMMTKYVLGSKHFGEMAVHYRTKYHLMEKGLLSSEKRDINRNNVETRKKEEEEEEDKINNFAPDKPDVGDDTCETVKKEARESEGSCRTNADPHSKDVDSLNIQKMSIIENTQSTHDQITKLGTFTPSKSTISGVASVSHPKLFCFSPSSKMLRQSPSGPMISKLQVHSPSQWQTDKKYSGLSPHIIKCNNLGSWKTVEDNTGNKQYRLLEVDDDLQLLEEIDDDVVWMGDDSCCFMDVDPPEIPLVDLCD